MKYYIMFGPPGAGKGTHAVALRDKYNLCHLSTGELLRAEIAAGTGLGRQAQKLIEGGNLVPDEVVERMIEKRFNSITDVEGFLLDGFPRTLGQANDLDKMLAARGDSVTAVISLMIPDEMVHQRIRRRAAIEGRADDASDVVIQNRINTYHAQTEPLIDYYKKQGKYFEVQADADTIEENRARVLDLMAKINK
ncbi:MAG: adenylate kinase [Bacteroidales bacterium]|nr:adenylate kinase [Bacteroidales bacterium]